MVRRVFYSFYYKHDAMRASQVRQIGTLEGNKPASDNDWEEVVGGGDEAIKRWIAAQIEGRSCTVVLVGEKTANRKWINYEIIKSWNAGMGVVGIRIHGLKDIGGSLASAGKNPFDYITFGNPKQKLSTVVKCYNPQGTNSKDRYKWIAKHLANAVEEAIKFRAAN